MGNPLASTPRGPSAGIKPDSNVLVSAARTGGICAAVVIETVRHRQVALSRPIVEEYRGIAERPAHARYRETLLTIVAELECVDVFVESADVTFDLRDPDDEVCLATAEAGGAVLVTGNKRDFTEQRYGSVECPERPAVPELLGKLEF